MPGPRTEFGSDACGSQRLILTRGQASLYRKLMDYGNYGVNLDPSMQPSRHFTNYHLFPQMAHGVTESVCIGVSPPFSPPPHNLPSSRLLPALCILYIIPILQLPSPVVNAFPFNTLPDLLHPLHHLLLQRGSFERADVLFELILRADPNNHTIISLPTPRITLRTQRRVMHQPPHHQLHNPTPLLLRQILNLPRRREMLRREEPIPVHLPLVDVVGPVGETAFGGDVVVGFIQVPIREQTSGKPVLFISTGGSRAGDRISASVAGREKLGTYGLYTTISSPYRRQQGISSLSILRCIGLYMA